MIWTFEVEVVHMCLRARNQHIALILTHDRVHTCGKSWGLSELVELHVETQAQAVDIAETGDSRGVASGERIIDTIKLL